MKTKRFLCIILVTVLAFTLIPLSSSAESVCPSNYYITYSPSYKEFKSSLYPFGDLLRVSDGQNIIECYQPKCRLSDGRIVYEWYGLFSHEFEEGKILNFGAWSFHFTTEDNGTYYRMKASLNGTPVYTPGAITAPRYGFTLVNLGGKTFVAMHLFSSQAKSTLDGNDYYLYDYNSFDYTLPYYSYGAELFIFDPSYAGTAWSFDTDMESTQTPATVFFDSWTSCPKCGSHNVSYKASFLHTGAMVVTGQIGYVFKCRDCGASWRGIVSNAEENELFKQYMKDVEYTETLVEDNSLPPFVTTGSTVDLPSDVGGVADYIQQAFAALSSFTAAFNDFFSAVFSVLPAPVLGVILLGVGLVVIIGIIKAVRG